MGRRDQTIVYSRLLKDPNLCLSMMNNQWCFVHLLIQNFRKTPGKREKSKEIYCTLPRDTPLRGFSVIQDKGIMRYKGNFKKYRKIPKMTPGAYIFQRPFWRSLYTKGNLHFKIGLSAAVSLYLEGNLRLKIDWANL